MLPRKQYSKRRRGLYCLKTRATSVDMLPRYIISIAVEPCQELCSTQRILSIDMTTLGMLVVRVISLQ